MHAVHFDRTIRNILAPPVRVLDIGYGSLSLALALARGPETTVEVLDVTPSSRAPWKEWSSGGAEDPPQGLRIRRSSLNRIPFEDDTFDAIVMSNVLEDSLDMLGALTEVARVLRPGGLLFCITTDRTLASFLGHGLHTDNWRLLVQPKELEWALASLCFQNFTVQAWTLFKALAELSLLELMAGWPLWTLASSYVAQAVKDVEMAVKFQVHEPVALLPRTLDSPDEPSVCSIVGHGKEPDLYNLECCEGLEKRQRPTSVHARFIRKWPFLFVGDDARVRHNDTWLDCRVVGWGSLPCSYRVELSESRQELVDVFHERLQPPAEYKHGDRAEVFVEGGNNHSLGSWAECFITGAGDHRGTYHIRVWTPRGLSSHKDILNVPTDLLRA